MANQTASIASQIFGILKNNYKGAVVTQFNDDIPLYGEMEKGSEKYTGSQVVRSLKIRRNQGVGAGVDGGAMPSAGVQGNTQAQIQAKFNWLRFQITAGLMKAAQNDQGAFVSGISNEMEGGMDDLKTDVNRQMFWNGRGDLARMNANAVATNVITVKGRTDSEEGAKYLDVGAIIDIYSSVTSLPVATAVTVNAVSNPNSAVATLTLSQNVSASANDIIVHAGAFNNEIQGVITTLDSANPTSTIYGIDRSLYGVYAGNYSDLGGAQLTLGAMQNLYNATRRRGGGSMDALFGDYNSEAMYNKLLVADKRYVGKVTGDGTFSDKSKSYLEFAGVPFVPDKDNPQQILMLQRKYFKKYVLCELEWADESTELIPLTGVDGYEARLRLFANVFCEKPSAEGRLLGYVSP